MDTVVDVEPIITDLLYPPELSEMEAEKYITARTDGIVTIYNYTNKAVYANMWNNTTRTCRGLIVDNETQEVLARPFRKFFNWNERGYLNGEVHGSSVALNPTTPVTVYDKIDGSMVILYDHPEKGLSFATKGSLDSPQAQYADLLLDLYPGFVPPQEFTLVFEVVYPENRVVVDYGNTQELVLLGMVHKHTGIEYQPSMLNNYMDVSPFPQPRDFPEIVTLGSAIRHTLDADNGENREGVVAWCQHTGTKVKCKFAEYLHAHKFAANATPERLWKRIAMLSLVDIGGWEFALKQLGITQEEADGMASVPEELYAEHNETTEGFANDYFDAWTKHREKLWDIQSRVSTPKGTVDAEFAREVNIACENENLSPHVFFAMQKDKLEQHTYLWKSVKPE